MTKDNPSVLYVEDNPSSRRIVRMLLKNRMKLENVIIFQNSKDFKTSIKALNPKPDLIFLDIHVKPYNGFEMLQILRESDEFSDTKIVALTASVMNEEIEQLRDAGFDGCMSKPIDIDTFPGSMNDILEGKPVWEILG